MNDSRNTEADDWKNKSYEKERIIESFTKRSERNAKKPRTSGQLWSEIEYLYKNHDTFIKHKKIKGMVEVSFIDTPIIKL